MARHYGASNDDVPQLQLDNDVPLPQTATRIDARRHNMGKGLKALSPIPAGTLIISEPPLFTAPSAFSFSPSTPAGERLLTAHIATLTTSQKSSWDILSSYHPFITLPHGTYTTSSNLSRFKTSGIPIPLGSRRRHIDRVGVFATTSWANHACHHNAQHSWNSATQQLDLYALRHIGKNEAITINYAPENIISRLYIYVTFKFKCFCAWCEDDVESGERLESNGNRRRINDGLLYVHREPDVGKAMQAANQVLALLITEDVKDFRFGLLFSDCLDVAVQMGDGGRARILGWHAVRAYRHCEGNGDSVRAIRRALGRLMKAGLGAEGKEEGKGKGKAVEIDEGDDTEATEDDDVLPEGLDAWIEEGHEEFVERQAVDEDAFSWLFMSELWPSS